MGLFMIIGGVVKVGLIKWMSIKVLEITQGNLFGTSMVISVVFSLCIGLY